MSTVRSIERRMFLRRQMDRELSTSGQPGTAVRSQGMEWSGVWSGYAVFAGVAVLLLFLVLGIGFSSVNPMNPSSWASAGKGMAIWSVIVLLISTFIGGWVTGRIPAATRAHGIMKSITLWGLIMISSVLALGWIAGKAMTAAAHAATSATTAVSHAATTGVNMLQGQLRTDGLHVSRAQAAIIGGQMTAGHPGAAATALAHDAAISTARASAIIQGMAPNYSRLGGAAANLGKNVSSGAKTGGSAVTWAGFWLALISLGCAMAGGAVGGGGMKMKKTRQ